MSDSFKQIGEILASARKEQKKELADVSESTKIMVKYLEAIEAGDPTNLPSPTYFLLFARSYAQNIGIDPGVIDEMADRDPSHAQGTGNGEKADDVDEADPVDPNARNFGKSILILIIIIVVVFAALLIYNFGFGDSDDQAASDGADSMAVHTSLSTPTDFEKSGIEVTPYTPPEPLKMHLVARQDVWTFVVRDGDTVLNRELKAGEQRSWEAKYRYYLTLGISTAVELTLNGEPVGQLTDRARTVSNIEINQINYKDFLQKNRGAETPVIASPPPPPVTQRPAAEPGATPPVAKPTAAVTAPDATASQKPDSGQGATGNGN